MRLEANSSGIFADGKPVMPRSFDIFVDGGRVEGCTFADDVEGVVEYIAKDRRGNYIIGKPLQEDVIRVTIHGNVRIERRS